MPLEQLEWLKLDGTRVSDEGVALLARLKHLQIVSLYDTQATQHGVERLRQALPQTRVDWDSAAMPEVR